MKITRIVKIGLAGFYGLLWSGGVFSYLFLGGPPEGVEWTAPTFLATASLLVFISMRRSEWPILLLGGAIGFASEAVGVKFGFPFGSYTYTATLDPRWLGVPLVMAAAWVVLFAYVRQMVRRPLAAAAWMTAIDLVIDPLAANGLGYWTWEHPGPYYGIPWSNFAGWFAVSFLLFSLDRRPVIPSAPVRWVGLSQIVFFTAIAFGTGAVLAGVFGVALLTLHAARRLRESGRWTRSNESIPPATPPR
ncbi:MAG: carotenoid biosynthesis protein [Kiritimatiellia bacterium]|nr:carotenoid biosynthesis protein [Kiritimatiellia bacterium]